MVTDLAGVKVERRGVATRHLHNNKTHQHKLIRNELEDYHSSLRGLQESSHNVLVNYI